MGQKKNKIASLYNDKKWSRKLQKKIMGKFIVIGFTDTKATAQGVAFSSYYDVNDPSTRSTLDNQILTPEGDIIAIDSPSQIIAVEEMNWPSYYR